VWTVENLRTTKYSDETKTVIPLVTNSSVWSALRTPGRCWYENDSASNHATYGVLYNWYAVHPGKLAPDGWRVPTDADWTALQNYLIGNGYNWDSTTTGNKIGKSLAARTDWSSWLTAGTIGNDRGKNNASGFSALPGGSRSYDGSFRLIGNSGGWWSAEQFDASDAWNRGLDYLGESLYRYYGSKGWGFSVRLLRDN
jgi:uncharacterized protein (TIGR02145 family)